MNVVYWAPRIARDKIKRLYENEAKGILDEDLLNDVAYSLYARCESIIIATSAKHKKVICPVCKSHIIRGNDRYEIIACPSCKWTVIWDDYYKSYCNKLLNGGHAIHAFESYIKRFSLVKSPRELMLLIDWLVHEVHRGLPTATCRPAAVNLIEGDIYKVTDLLDGLAYGDCTPQEIIGNKSMWIEQIRDRLWSVVNSKKY